MLTGELTIREAWNQTYDVNVSGTHVITNVFAPLLLKSSDPRLLFLTSGLATLEGYSKSNMAGPTSLSVNAGWPKQVGTPIVAYRSSKCALNMMMLSWHWLFEKDGVKVWSISPGFLATKLGGDPEVLKARGAGDPSIGGIFIKKVIEGERDADVGKAINSGGIQPF